MPKCVATNCQKYFHPDFCVMLEPDNEKSPCKCVFCYTEKKEVTVSDDDGKPLYTVTKKEAEENYKRYIQDLKESDKIAKVLTKDDGNRLK